MGTEGFGPRIVFYIDNVPFLGQLEINETVTVTWFIIIMFAVFSILVSRNLKKEASGVQLIVETLVKTINNLVEDTMGSDKMGFAPYMGTLMLFLAVGNLMGLIGMRPPTADLNTTLALAMMTFVLTQFFGIKSKGLLGYGKSFLEPIAILLPINIIGELANPISLSFRLFGNVVAGFIIMTLIYGGLGGLSATIFPFGDTVPVLMAGLPAIFHGYFDVFSGLLQSFIFTMLSMVFVAGAME